MMLRPRLAAAATVAAVLATVTACGGSSGGSSPASTTAGTGAGTSSASTSDASTSATFSSAKGGQAPANTSPLIFVLEAVNPKMGTDKSALVSRSKALCVHINANESPGQLAAAAAKGFTNGSWVPSDAEAQAIVSTVKAYGGC